MARRGFFCALLEEGETGKGLRRDMARSGQDAEVVKCLRLQRRREKEYTEGKATKWEGKSRKQEDAGFRASEEVRSDVVKPFKARGRWNWVKSKRWMQ